MGGRRGFGHRNRQTGGHTKCFYDLEVNRSLVHPHHEVEEFVLDIEERLGDRFERAKEVRGVTIVESRALLAAIKDKRQMIDHEILAEAEADLKEVVYENGINPGPIDVPVDQHLPLKVYGRHRDVVALHLVPDIRLGADRGAVQAYIDVMTENVGENERTLRGLPLDPHIKLGTIKPHLFDADERDMFTEDPLEFLNTPPQEATKFEALLFNGMPRIIPPLEVSLNGLRIAVEPRT